MNFHTTESVVNLYPNTHEFYILKDCVCIFMTDKIIKALARSVQHELQYSSHLCGPTTCFSHSRQLKNLWVLPVQWAQHKQKMSSCLCIHISAQDLCWRDLCGGTHISLMRAVRTDASWTNSAFCWAAWSCWPCVAWCCFCCGTTSVSLLTTCARTQSTVRSMCCLIWISKGFLHMDQPEAVMLNNMKTVPKGTQRLGLGGNRVYKMHRLLLCC